MLGPRAVTPPLNVAAPAPREIGPAAGGPNPGAATAAPDASEDKPVVSAAKAQARSNALLRRARASAQSSSVNCPTAFPKPRRRELAVERRVIRQPNIEF